MVLRRVVFSFMFFYIIFLCGGCRRNTDTSIFRKSGLIAPCYYLEKPLGSIANQNVQAIEDTLFILEKNSFVQIYATGELNIDLAITPRSYYFKGDDVEIFFQVLNRANRIENKSLAFTWGESNTQDNKMATKKEGCSHRVTYDNQSKSYIAVTSIPWSYLYLKDPAGKLIFDVAIGDNDDRIKQKSKIALFSKQDPNISFEPNGILLTRKDDNFSPDTNCILSLQRVRNGALSDSEWDGTKLYPLNHIVSGEIQGPTDLSGSVQSCWDKDSLFIRTKIFDSKRGITNRDMVQNSPTFHDYGWIEDSGGSTVWKMNAWYSKEAGGARKNQIIDTCIFLKAGRYHLKYITDESHSWDRWDDESPFKSFYGIVLYHHKKGE